MDSKKDSNLSEELITKLEVKVSYLEDFMNQLQEAAVDQAKEIERLKKENKLLEDKVRDIIENMDMDIPNRKPPHY